MSQTIYDDFILKTESLDFEFQPISVGNGLILKKNVFTSTNGFSYDSIDTGESPVSGGPAAAMDQPHVIPSQGDLLGDLLNLDLGPPVNVPQVSSMQMGAVDLLGGGLDSLVSLNTHSHTHRNKQTHG